MVRLFVYIQEYRTYRIRRKRIFIFFRVFLRYEKFVVIHVRSCILRNNKKEDRFLSQKRFRLRLSICKPVQHSELGFQAYAEPASKAIL